VSIELILALALALGVAYLIADLAARLAQAALRTVAGESAADAIFVDRPRRVVRSVIFLVAAIALVFPAMRAAGHPTGFGGNPEDVLAWLLDSGLRIVVIAVIAYLVIRIGSASARRFEREMSQGSGLDVVERSKRAQTLGRLLQKTLTIGVCAMAALMILRELNVDITPVLTGAGIAGLAIGFGAQTLVRDVISGFFLIFEDQVRVGDVAVVNGQAGLVEALNLRTIVLRDMEGTVHVVPNGEIKTLANRSKDFSYFVLDLGISYRDDVDRVSAALRAIGQSLMDDPVCRQSILEPLEIIGVEAFAEGHVTLKARIKTVPLKQWEIGRELRRRILREFKERDIEIPMAQRTIWIREAPRD
jgi:small conductance mechanosensitive channel